MLCFVLIGVFWSSADPSPAGAASAEAREWNPARARKLLDRVRSTPFKLLLPPEMRDYISDNRFEQPSLEVGRPLAKHSDSDGFPIYTRQGEAAHYHSIFLAFRVLWLLDAYRLSTDAGVREWFLEYAERIAAKLEVNAVPHEGAYFFPSEWDRVRHGHRHEGPRVSGMKQGVLLQAFSALHRTTGAAHYRELAKRTFRSFFFVEGEVDGGWWVSTIDDDGYLWIELYPKSPPSHTLNGFIFAIFGIHEYYTITRDPEAKELLLAALTTVREQASLVRHPGDISSKSIEYRHNKPRKYHRVHIRQFQHLYRMTGDPVFHRLARQFQDDLLAYDTLMNRYHDASDQAERALRLVSRLLDLEFDRSTLYPLKKSYEAWASRQSFSPRVFKEIRRGKRAHYKAIRKALSRRSDRPPCGPDTLLGVVLEDWSSFLEAERSLVADLGRTVTGSEEPWAIRRLLSEHLRQELAEAEAFRGALGGHCAAGE